MLPSCLTFVLINVFTTVSSKIDFTNSGNVITTKTLAIWRNATVPFYVNPAHFDHEQTTEILSALSNFAFKTCIKFKPVMARPLPTDEVMVFINPDGTKRCIFDTTGHSVFNPHFVKLGYECLKPPHIDMMIMRALGFPFEHNRDTRDLYIEVLNENIEPGFVELFTKEDVLPLELRFLPYDVNSVMHFANRDYSKNGHRTFIFKDSSVQQYRNGLTDTDVKKIEVVYGPECRARDRQEKLELCQSYPGVARRKRQAEDNTLGDKERTPEPVDRKKRNANETMATKSLRVNPNITPPPLNQSEDITRTLKELGIDEAVENIVDQVYKVSSLALKNARAKYCNNSDDKPADLKVAREGDEFKSRSSSDVLGIIEVVADFAKGMVDHAIQNLTKFCEHSEGLEVYQRYSCSMGRDPRCRETYRSTKSGAVHYSTQHRPIIQQSTSHKGGNKLKRNYARGGNVTEVIEVTAKTKPIRRKRDLDTVTVKPDVKELEPVTSDDNKNNQTGDSLQEVAVDKTLDSEKKNITDNSEKVSESVTEIGDNTKIAIDDPKVKKVEKGASPITGETFENKTATVKYVKSKLVEAEMGDIEAKFDEKTKINNKDYLRANTHVPSSGRLGKKRYQQRRSSGLVSEHPVASDRLDTMLAKKIVEKKHLIQKNMRKRTPRLTEPGLLNEAPQLFKEEKRDKNKNQASIPARAYVKNDEGVSEETTSDSPEISKADDYEKEKHSEDVEKSKKKPTKKISVKDSDADENSMTESEKYSEEKPPRKVKHKKKHSLPKTVPLSKKNKDFYSDRMWPTGEVVYMIQVDTTYDISDMRSRLAEVREILEERTCVKLTEIKPHKVNRFEDYLVIDNSPDYVTGRVGGQQRFGSIELFRGGQHRQHAAMMVMAMLGFYFEVSRHDRDKHIRVHMRHVRPDKLHHFEKIRSDATLPLPYDYASATHPAWQFWRQVGRTGISTVATYKEQDPDGHVMKSLGQNEHLLSDIDIVKINSVYGIDCFKNPRAKADHLGLNNDTLPLPEVEEKKHSAE